MKATDLPGTVIGLSIARLVVHIDLIGGRRRAGIVHGHAVVVVAVVDAVAETVARRQVVRIILRHCTGR